MITTAIIHALTAVAAFAVSLVPSIPLPGFVTTVGDYISQGLSAAGAFGNFFPVQALVDAFAFLLACLSTAFAVRLIRIAVSAFTGGGGGAA